MTSESSIPKIEDLREQIGTIQFHRFPDTNAVVCCIKVKNGLTFLGTAQAAGTFDLEVGKATAYEKAETSYFEAALYSYRQNLYEYVQSEVN